MKSVLISVKPYYVFLIIAEKMNWHIEKHKTIEVRKNCPKSNWNKIAHIYCTKDKKSFAKIPKEYRSIMQRFLGKVIGAFVCDGFEHFRPTENGVGFKHFLSLKRTCLSLSEIKEYLGTKDGYGWHISDLKIYDEPKELREFKKIHRDCWYADLGFAKRDCPECNSQDCFISRPPQSWCYVEQIPLSDG